MNDRASRQRDQIVLMGREYKALTGEDFYKGITGPDLTIEFTDGSFHSYRSAFDHMTEALESARASDRLAKGGPWEPGEREALQKIVGDYVTNDPDGRQS